jgi:hypothetical protein
MREVKVLGDVLALMKGYNDFVDVVTPHVRVQCTLGSDRKVHYTSHHTLGSNALWGQNREIDPKVR